MDTKHSASATRGAVTCIVSVRAWGIAETLRGQSAGLSYAADVVELVFVCHCKHHVANSCDTEQHALELQRSGRVHLQGPNDLGHQIPHC